MIRVAINGYGRIGRNVHRQFVQRFSKEVEVIAVNASSDSATRAYLLRHDSLHGRFDEKIVVENEDEFSVNGTRVRVVKERDTAKCPWKELEVDIVVEATGHFVLSETAKLHLEAGAKKVVVTAPMKDETPTFVFGVNEDQLTADIDILSNTT